MDPLVFSPIPSSPLLLHSSLDDSSSASSSSYSTPRSSLDNPERESSSDDSHRPSSLASIDSGYFSNMLLETDGERTRKLSKPPKQASDTDTRRPLTPVNNQSTDQEPPKRKGIFANTLRKKKRSLAAVNPPASDAEPFPIALQANHAREKNLPPHSLDAEAEIPFPGDDDEMDNPLSQKFEPKDYFIYRQNMRHHPYPPNEAPYMQAYNQILLENDMYSEKLLRHLNPNSPSFQNFGEGFPASILDLGCGPGTWAVDAATFWKSSRVIGLDIIHPSRLRGGADQPSNVEWMQGNFVQHRLPFPNNVFDLVRMANLSLCIPVKRWSAVLQEVRRVLTPGGSLELIDDHIYFPYAKIAPQPPSTPHIPPRPRPSSSSLNDDNKDDSDNDPPDPDDPDDEMEPQRASRLSTLFKRPGSPTELIDHVAEWEKNTANAKALEKKFEEMLHNKFKIHPRPLEFIEKAFDEIFGRYHSAKLQELNLYLAPPASKGPDRSSVISQESGGTALKKAGKDLAKWMTTVEWDKKEKEKGKKERTKGDRSSGESAVDVSTLPEAVNPKAARRLGIISTGPHRSSFTQSPGLILWPNTFIAIPPSELEMHACKYIHTLLGCQAALCDYLSESSPQPIPEGWIKEWLWQYECFRRKRFNWPAEIPESLDTPSTDAPPKSPAHHPTQDHAGRARSGSTSSTASPSDELDFIRRIKVFSATKVEEKVPPIP
ncbi:hypothetical protein F5I97DRAFT_1878339 [Phlebopus sp. FC_14]|nr:hypothetical protein F5I97DRAFT_1878339 [Phlebopus sp. FC_14]